MPYRGSYILLMYQQMIMRCPALVCLCYEQDFNRRAAILANTLYIARDFRVYFPVPLAKLVSFVKRIKVEAVAGEPQTRTANRFELLLCPEREGSEPSPCGLVYLGVCAQPPLICAGAETPGARPATDGKFDGTNIGDFLDRLEASPAKPAPLERRCGTQMAVHRRLAVAGYVPFDDGNISRVARAIGQADGAALIERAFDE